MRLKAGRYHRGASRGFTLVELLLAISLMLLLMGAVVFSVSSLQRGAGLDEGINQFEALIQFARAQAANTGRRVQIQCFERTFSGAPEPELELRVVWERDPVGQPGVFDELTEAGPYLRGIPDLVRVKSIQSLEGDASPSSMEIASTNAVASTAPRPSASSGSGSAPVEQLAPAYPPITFYPDGSSESVEIVLAAQDEEDGRRFSLRLAGLTGSIHRKLLPHDTQLAESEPVNAHPEEALPEDEPTADTPQ